MIRIVAEADDVEARQLQTALLERGVQTDVWTLDDLTETCELTLRIDTRGTTSRVSMRDGRVLASEDHGLIINRLAQVAPRGTDPTDAAYVAEEWRAVIAAWLRSLRCPVLNPPRAATLAGAVLSRMQWRSIAHAHGLRALPFQSARTSEALEVARIVCVETRCFGDLPVPRSIATRLVAVAGYCGTPLLEAKFERHAEQWYFVDADPRPVLSGAPVAVLDALIETSHPRTVSA